MDVAIVLDLSGSNEEIMDAIFEFTRMLTLGLPVASGAARVAVVSYSDSANFVFGFNQFTTSQKVTSTICKFRPILQVK